nr:response regulator transcription factor [Lysinibacillus timonensis]
MRKISIIIAEDQVLLGKSLNIVLNTDDRFIVSGVAQNGQEAIQMCHEHNPNIVLMDIKMPVIDGVSATKTIKKKFPDIKVIILTTFSEINFVNAALQAGADGFLLKASEPEILIEKIKAVCNGGRSVTEQLLKPIVNQMPSRPLKKELVESTV